MTEAVAVDCHVKVLDEAVVQRARARGLDAIVYAPHFTRWPDIRERAAAFSTDDLLVIPGRELFTGPWRDRRHVLALDLERPIPDFCTLAGTMAELADQDAAVLVPHPGFMTVSLGAEQIDAYADQIDAIEVYNPKHRFYHNRRAQSLAGRIDAAPFGSSYAHLRGTVGEVWTEVEAAIDEPGDLAEALRSGVSTTVHHRTGPVHQFRCGLEFAHLGYENSWSKLDRIFLQGTEATHPNHVAYEGAFDDVKVY